MSHFLIFYTFVYGGMNAYIVWRVRQAFLNRRTFIYPFALLCGCMVFGPILVRLFWGTAPGIGIHLFSLFAFTWAAWIFWFFCTVFLLDVWNTAQTRLGKNKFIVSPRRKISVAVCLILVASCWGIIEARHLHLHTYHIQLDHLPSGTPPIRLLQFSDLHLTRLIGEQRLEQIVQFAKDTHPDLIVSTGDCIDNRLEDLTDAAAKFAALQPPLGKYAVFGNHEFYMTAHESQRFHEAAGFRVLHAESVKVSDHLRIAGVDDPAARYASLPGDQVSSDEDAALTRHHYPEAVILLKHRPNVDSGSRGLFDLQLSGHAHGGQIFPFGLFVRLQYHWTNGLHKLKGNWLYINQGAGTWGPPFRVFAPPEVALFILEPAIPKN
ncbi:TPA: hypothetical protein DDW35_13305 [Candidatus Sumerlaeota bacterium]|jgi:uncharacterized protein|nr:hypothetical protein [Candidatus Sumerlaeota bacterium]